MAKKSSCSSSSPQNPKQEKPSSFLKKQTSNSRKKTFTFDDEILILNCFLDFKSNLGQNVMTNYTTFYNSVKDLLSVKPTEGQLRKMIWKLKQKYENMKKEENQKFPPRFYNDLEQEIIYLSHKIWGQELIGESDRVELDGMWTELKVQEMELALECARLIKDSTDVISKALQGSSSS